MLRLLASSTLVLATIAGATELRPISVRTGTEGLARTPVTITNSGRETISCSADIAHWYSLEFGTAAPGAAIEIELWFDPATGTYAALNDKRENLPVERFWCGLAGRAYATRSEIMLDRSVDGIPVARHVGCAAGSERLACK